LVSPVDPIDAQAQKSSKAWKVWNATVWAALAVQWSAEAAAVDAI
jgi:hypothetical protein